MMWKTSNMNLCDLIVPLEFRRVDEVLNSLNEEEVFADSLNTSNSFLLGKLSQAQSGPSVLP